MNKTVNRRQLLDCISDITNVLGFGPATDSIFVDIDFNEFTNDQLINQIIIDSESFNGTEQFKDETVAVLKLLGIEK